MRAIIRYKKESPFTGHIEIRDNLKEIHFNYKSAEDNKKVAFEGYETGGTMYLEYIEEIEIFDNNSSESQLLNHKLLKKGELTNSD